MDYQQLEVFANKNSLQLCYNEEKNNGFFQAISAALSQSGENISANEIYSLVRNEITNSPNNYVNIPNIQEVDKAISSGVLFDEEMLQIVANLLKITIKLYTFDSTIIDNISVTNTDPKILTIGSTNVHYFSLIPYLD